MGENQTEDREEQQPRQESAELGREERIAKLQTILDEGASAGRMPDQTIAEFDKAYKEQFEPGAELTEEESPELIAQYRAANARARLGAHEVRRLIKAGFEIPAGVEANVLLGAEAGEKFDELNTRMLLKTKELLPVDKEVPGISVNDVPGFGKLGMLDSEYMKAMAENRPAMMYAAQVEPTATDSNNTRHIRIRGIGTVNDLSAHISMEENGIDMYSWEQGGVNHELSRYKRNNSVQYHAASDIRIQTMNADKGMEALANVLNSLKLPDEDPETEKKALLALVNAIKADPETLNRIV